MTTRYEEIQAKTREEAIKRSSYKVGDLVPVIQVEAVANNGGTYSVFPIIEPAKKK